jgi:oxygen-independent coproporphyrinogen-3 oxidase
MLLTIEGLASDYELRSLAHMLFVQTAKTESKTPDRLLAQAADENGLTRLRIALSLGGAQKVLEESTPCGLSDDEKSLWLSRMLFRAALELTGEPLRWGILTGIRPVKLFMAARAEGLTDDETARRMREVYCVGDAMIDLGLELARAEEKICARSLARGFSLYVAIPFCPQRCAYCSFVSHAVARARRLIPDYVTLLRREIAAAGALAQKLGRGGGFPVIGGWWSSVFFSGGAPPPDAWCRRALAAF